MVQSGGPLKLVTEVIWMLNLNCLEGSVSVSVNDETITPEFVHVNDDILPSVPSFCIRFVGARGMAAIHLNSADHVLRINPESIVCTRK